MTNKHSGQNFSENPDPQEKRLSRDVINHLQEQQILPDGLPMKLVDWLARINRRYLAINQGRTNDTS